MSKLNRAHKVALLKAVPMFQGLSQRQLNAIAKEAYERKVAAGVTVAKQGTPGKEFFIIADGNLHIELNGVLVRTLSQGHFFGEVSLIDGRLRSASVIAQTPATLVCLHAQSFGALLREVPGLSDKVMLSLCRYLRRAEAALAECSQRLAR